MAHQRIAATASGEPPIHPGELFKRDVLPALDLSISEAARRLRVSRQTLHRMMAGTHAVTPEMALRLGRFCGSGPHLWLRIQQNYDLWNVEQTARAELEFIPLASPIADRAAETATTETSEGEGRSEDEIDRLYDEIADLTEKLSELDDQDFLARSLTEAQIDAAYVELRRLQTEEARQFRKAFEASLELPLSEGPRLVQEAHALIHALEQVVGADGTERAYAPAEKPATAEAPAAVGKKAAAEAPAVEAPIDGRQHQQLREPAP